jgi:uncharacterized protein YuzE
MGTLAEAFEYDSEADAVYVRLSDEPYDHGHDLDDDRRIDYDPSGSPMGIELLNVSHGVQLCGLPNTEAVSHLLRTHRIKTVRVA